MQITSGMFYFLIVLWSLFPNGLFNQELKEYSAGDNIYICFEEDSGLIKIEQLAGSSVTTFKIPRKGYETMDKRRMAYYDRLENEEELLPVNALYFFEFYATTYPEEKNLSTLQEFLCRTPEELREGGIDPENNSHFIFIQMISDEYILVWKNVKRRVRV